MPRSLPHSLVPVSSILLLTLLSPDTTAVGSSTPLGADSTPPSTVLVDDGAWYPVNPAGTLPAGRREFSIAYDPIGDRVIVFGGYFGLGETLSLELSGAPVWVNLNPAHTPNVRTNATAAYDPVRRRMIIFGGDDHTGWTNEVWALNLDGVPDWQQLAPQGTGPAGRSWSVVVYDPQRDRLLIQGGRRPDDLYGDVWALNLGGPLAWERIVTAYTPSVIRWGHVGFYDPIGDRLVIALGSTSLGYNSTSDAWALSLSGSPQWTPLSPSGTLPQPRMLATAVYDEARARLVLYGGYPNIPPEVWALTMSGQPAWNKLSPQGTPPPARWSHGAVFRFPYEQMVVYGGWDGSDFRADALTLTFPPVQSGPPEIRSFAPIGGRIGDPVVIGGASLTSATDVRFNGVSAPIHSNFYSSIGTEVPAGATTGPISVTTPLGTATSIPSFFVGEISVISSAVPDSGKVGAHVTLRGRHFLDATKVSFGGTGSATFTIGSDSVIAAIVDSLATTGQIRVTSPVGVGLSAFQFRVLPPDPRPRVVVVRDVPGDQGGRVVVAWEASDFDKPSYRVITGYRVWRRAYVRPGAGELTGATGDRLVTRAVGPPGALSTEFWESLTELPAVFLDGYAYSAPTLQDSTAAGNPHTVFFVQALTADRFTFYDSSPDSGYSVDNLSPPQPLPFAALYKTSEVALHWAKSPAPDFREFRLYRGTRADFVPGPGNLVLVGSDTGFVDTPPQTALAYYKLAAVDIHGNPSRYAAISPDAPVAALASLVSVSAQADRILLIWYAGGNPGEVATVYRRTADTEWSPLGAITADGRGYLRYEDRAVVSSARYGYRLGFRDGDAESFAGEAWATAERMDFVLEGVRPNPARREQITVHFVLGTPGQASLELLDIAGRRVAAREVGSLGPGRHAVNLAAGARLSPGVYLVRFTQGANQRAARVAVLD